MNITINENEIDFILKCLPAYSEICPEYQEVYLGLVKRIAEYKESEKLLFKFPINDSSTQYRNEVIKMVRSFTNYGLYNCKQMVESGAIFSLKEFNTKKEVLEYACSRATMPIIIEWLHEYEV